MTKWALFKANKSCNTLVLEQLSRAHKENVDCNQRYLRVIIKCLMHSVQQNSPLRGHKESKHHIWEVSETNRGNFIKSLHVCCKDLPWSKNMLQSQFKAHHAQWTSPRIQNELIEIVLDMVQQRIAGDIRNSEQFSIIVDRIPVISKLEQVPLCLRYVCAGEIVKTFVGFSTTTLTEGEVFFELVKKEIVNLELKLENIVGECFDGAANMSGVHKGLATRMKECPPLVVYVHCYGHLLNLTSRYNNIY